jgi:predicted metal-dependent peptidase
MADPAARDPRDRPMSALAPGIRLSTAMLVAMEAMPYFRSGLNNLVPVEAPGLGTLGVTEGSVLLVDTAKMGEWSPNEAGSVVIHEHLHIFLNHAARFRKLVALGILHETPADHDLWNQAADAEANGSLIDAGMKLPGNPCTAAALGLKPNRLAEEYASELLKRRPPPNPNRQAGGGNCGSGAGGNPYPNEPPPADPINRDPVDQEMMRKAGAEAINKHQSGHGNVPEGLKRFAESLLTPSQVPWQELFAMEVRRAVAFRPGGTDTSYTRPSRRQGAFRGMANAPILPAMRTPVVDVAFVADTSGSMGDAEMDETLNEGEAVLRAIPNSRCVFVACDAQVHTIKAVKSVQEMRAGMKGGGGTDFRPAFDALKKMPRPPAVVVFATDGFGSAPDFMPTNMSVIWLLVGKQTRVPAPWGKVIAIDREAVETDKP